MVRAALLCYIAGSLLFVAGSVLMLIDNLRRPS
jgi:hypothetical protein